MAPARSATLRAAPEPALARTTHAGVDTGAVALISAGTTVLLGLVRHGCGAPLRARRVCAPARVEDLVAARDKRGRETARGSGRPPCARRRGTRDAHTRPRRPATEALLLQERLLALDE